MRSSPFRRLAAALHAAAAAVAAPLLAAAGMAGAQAPAASAPTARVAMVATVEGVIGPATSDHLQRTLRRAAEAGAAVLVLRIDTPGGLDTSMREMIRGVLASPVPVVAYVAPGGARAASAGTYLLYASHIAAMAPTTHLGAATPIALGGAAPRGGPTAGASAPPSAPAAATPGTAEAKAVNDAVAYIRGLAELRGRNADWAERAVRESVSLPSHEAVAQRVVDLQAASVEELLQQIHGRTVQLPQGSVTLDTAGLALQELPTDWRTRLLGAIGNPNLALILVTLGFYGLLFEIMNPGTLFPGVLGGISLLIGLYALSALPLSLAGAALLVLGLALMVAEGFMPSFGVLGIGGLLAFVFGAGMLIDTDVPGLALSMPLAAGLAAAALGFLLVAVRMAVASRRQPPRSGIDRLVGRTARVLDWSGSGGHVLLDGERWQALSAGGDTLAAGQAVQVRAFQGLRVVVAPGATAPGAQRPPFDDRR
ncbi:nodulation protein NfeD [Aquincola sp. MAHUQ-54]|uniref:Nodulation protein NfeD n=1 Tax=Aquincola agrisoli TaxID=3119538 RepID=A0AAW9QJU6_9BURK